MRPARLQGVEAARGVAAVLVVLSHAGTLLAGPRDFGSLPFGGVLHFGYAGVDFFFVLSGFIIAHVHAGDIGRPERLGRYALRRLVRIYPLYWVVLGLFLLLLAASPSREGFERDPVSLLTSALLLPHPAHEPILGVAWTLQHEVLFYLMFATLLVSRRAGTAVLGLWLALVALAAGWPGMHLPYPLGFVASLYNAEFFVGMAVAALLRRRAVWPFTCLGAGAVLFVAVGLYDDAGGVDVHLPALRLSYAAAGGLALYGVAGAELAAIGGGGRLPVPALLRHAGGASYSIYLVHVILLLMIQQALRAAHQGPLHGLLPRDMAFGAAVALTVGLAILFSRGVERPLLRRCQAALRGGAVRGAAVPR